MEVVNLNKNLNNSNHNKNSRSNRNRSRLFALTAFILGEVTEDERARWMRMLVVLGLAGMIIIFSPDIISFMTGMSIPANPVDNVNNSTGNPPADGLEDSTGVPINTVRAILNLFTMLRFMGVAVAVIGGVFSVVKL